MYPIKLSGGSSAAHRPKVLLEPAWRLQYWTRVLDASEAELRLVVDEVGCQAHRVCARLWELRLPSADG